LRATMSQKSSVPQAISFVSQVLKWDTVCGWFTEGFDTLDLKEAKALLEELAR
jgi:hypothetical protein